jgi:tetratricopeptide (TPR) repeat protein
MKRLLALVLFLISSYSSQAQKDIFDLESSKSYAAYLLESGQYKSAISEYERVVFLDSSDLASSLLLLKSYRLAEDFTQGTIKASSLFPNIISMPKEHALEYSKTLMSLRDWEKANDFWNKSVYLSSNDKVLLKTTVDIFEGDFRKAQKQILNINDSTNVLGVNYKSIIDRGLNERRKSPLLAGLLSTAVPGLGKVYTGDWKDAIVSLIFTGGMAFQAVRNFNRHGAGNYRPWVYTTIGTGFYLGNIVGSVKSAKDKNRKKINLLQHEASDYFNSFY